MTRTATAVVTELDSGVDTAWSGLCAAAVVCLSARVGRTVWRDCADCLGLRGGGTDAGRSCVSNEVSWTSRIVPSVRLGIRFRLLKESVVHDDASVAVSSSNWLTYHVASRLPPAASLLSDGGPIDHRLGCEHLGGIDDAGDRLATSRPRNRRRAQGSPTASRHRPRVIRVTDEPVLGREHPSSVRSGVAVGMREWLVDCAPFRR